MQRRAAAVKGLKGLNGLKGLKGLGLVTELAGQKTSRSFGHTASTGLLTR